MNAQDITQIIKSQFPSAILAEFPADKHPRVHVTAENWREMARFVHDDPRLKLDWLANLSGVDYAADSKIAVVYDLYSFELKHTFAIKVFCDRANPHIPSVQDLWAIANWHEREAFDMLGIIFDGHPNLIRILCDEHWVGYPLRKDYVFPKEFQGIPGTLNLEWDPSSKAPAK
jgi:NADH-quinone oxidoreductase subunit C